MLNFALEKGIFLEEILGKKSMIRFQIKGENAWYVTTVESVRGNEIILAFPEMFAAVDVILGDILNCKFTNGNCEYIFESEIESVKIYFPQQIKLRVIGEVKKCENIRKCKRYEAVFLANIFVKGEAEVAHSCVRDISITGLRVVSKHYIRKGTEVGIHIVLPQRNIFDSVIKLKGKVMWSKLMFNRNEYGIAVTEMTELDRRKLEQLLKSYEK